MDNLSARVDALEHHLHTAQQRLRWWRRLGWGLGMLALLGWALHAGPAADAQSTPLGDRLDDVEDILRKLKEILPHVTIAKDDAGRLEIILSGVNLRIVNGLGSTDCTDEQFNPIPDCPNGLGNLIVGYNELRGSGEENLRTGSHNVVVGQQHNFSRFGGMVVGRHNTISGTYAAVSGGDSNTASGDSASVNGGDSNTASGFTAFVSGGNFNIASGAFASVSGGDSNEASGDYTSVSGGYFNTASGYTASVSGGDSNTASGELASVSGGTFNTASGNHAAVSGGEANTASGLAASVSGGYFNTASGFAASVSGGRNRAAEGEYDWVAGSLFEDE